MLLVVVFILLSLFSLLFLVVDWKCVDLHLRLHLIALASFLSLALAFSFGRFRAFPTKGRTKNTNIGRSEKDTRNRTIIERYAASVGRCSAMCVCV